MKTIKLIDMTLALLPTLREGALTFKEKLEIARSLDRLKVDGIELAPIDGGKGDDVAATWESVRGAKQPRLNLLAPLSPL